MINTSIVRMLLVLAICFLNGCDLCGTHDEQSFPSPDGRLNAWVFDWDCGATTAANTQVSIHPASKPLPKHDPGNTYSQNRDAAVKVRWLSDTDFEITVAAKAEGTRNQKHESINLHYVVDPSVWSAP